MIKQLKITVLYLLISAFMILNANSQTNNQADIDISNSYWLNINSCPLKINVKENNPAMTSLFLENTSQATITDYQLGCISEENKTIKVKSEGIIEKIEIQSNTTNNNILYLPKSAHGNYLSSMCSLPNKVAVIRVNFADGGTWILKR